MRYEIKELTPELKMKIQEMEFALKKYREIVLSENKFIFENKNLEFYVDFDLDGPDHFQPGYCSAISIGIADKFNSNGELINLHIITIWKCYRSIFGLPISKNIPGSKITGEFLDESLEEVKEELKEYIEEFLSEEY